MAGVLDFMVSPSDQGQNLGVLAFERLLRKLWAKQDADPISISHFLRLSHSARPFQSVLVDMSVAVITFTRTPRAAAFRTLFYRMPKTFSLPQCNLGPS